MVPLTVAAAPGVPHSRCRSQFAAAPQSLQPPGALHSRFSPPASRDLTGLHAPLHVTPEDG